MRKTKLFRIVLKEREGQILLTIKKPCELSKRKLLEYQTIFLHARMIHTFTYEILILEAGVCKERTHLKIVCLWLRINHFIKINY